MLHDSKTARALCSKSLTVEHLHVVGPAGAELSVAGAIPFRDLAGRPFLLPSTRHGLRTIVERCAEECDIALNVAAEADSLNTLKELVLHDHGWTILPTAPIREDIAARRLRAAPLVEPVPERCLVLSYPADWPVARLARFAGEAIEDIFRQQIEGAWPAASGG